MGSLRCWPSTIVTVEGKTQQSFHCQACVEAQCQLGGQQEQLCAPASTTKKGWKNEFCEHADQNVPASQRHGKKANRAMQV